MATDAQTPPARPDPPNAYSVSAAGRDLIKSFSPFSASQAVAPFGLPVIGYQHVLRPGDMDITQIDEAHADALLQEDLLCIEIYLNATLRAPLQQHQFDALASLVFDEGMLRFEHSTLRNFLNAGHFEAAADALQHWGAHRVYERDQPGRARRNAEATLFRRGCDAMATNWGCPYGDVTP